MKTLMLFSFAFINLLLYSQSKSSSENCKFKEIKVNQVLITDSNFIDLLDTLLLLERKCIYFTDSVPYGVWIDKLQADNGDSVVVVVFIGNSDKEVIVKSGADLIGYLSYKGHDFFIKGRNVLDSIKITNKEKSIFCRKKVSPNEDDRWAIYRFLLYNHVFYLYDKENNWLCK